MATNRQTDERHIWNCDVDPRFSVAGTVEEAEEPASAPALVKPENCCPAAEIEPFEFEVSWLIDVKNGNPTTRRVFTPEKYWYLSHENGFVTAPLKDQPEHFRPKQIKLDWDEGKAVAQGVAVCPICNDQESFPALAYGLVTGIRVILQKPCSCRKFRRYWHHFPKPNGPVPAGFQDVTLQKILKGDYNNQHFRGVSKDFRELVFAALKARGDFNMLICGPAGIGKTTIFYGLYSEALRRWINESDRKKIPDQAVWCTDAHRLAKEWREWEMSVGNEDSDVPVPSLTRGKIENALAHGLSVCVLIDEYDKRKRDSIFQNTEFHSVFNALWASSDKANGQVAQAIVVSNFKPEEFAREFGAEFSEAVTRRLKGRPRGMLIDFHSRRVTINDEPVSLRNGVMVWTRSGKPVGTEQEEEAHLKGAATPQATPAPVSPKVEEVDPSEPIEEEPKASRPSYPRRGSIGNRRSQPTRYEDGDRNEEDGAQRKPRGSNLTPFNNMRSACKK